MIISHKHKFIFIKPQKTAGTSVELLLSRLCGDNDIITPLGHDPDPQVRAKAKAKPPQNYYRKKPLKHWQVKEIYYHFFTNNKVNQNYWEHLQADLIRQYIGDDTWDEYKKISIVRNPWDHAVSWFKWQEFRGNKNIVQGDFQRYLINDYKSTWPFYTVKNGLYDIDFMIRFENINQDVESLLNGMNVRDNFALPKTKNKVRSKKNFQDFYENERMKEIVQEKAMAVIEKFNYKFDE